MKLFIVDETTQAQAFCAKRIEAFSQNDIETLDLQVEAMSQYDVMDNLDEADVLVIGSGLGEGAISLAKEALTAVPWMHIILYVTDEAYGGGAFRAAHSAGVRKVFPDSANPLDLLQELVAVHAEFKREGRTKEGKVLSLIHI